MNNDKYILISAVGYNDIVGTFLDKKVLLDKIISDKKLYSLSNKLLQKISKIENVLKNNESDYNTEGMLLSIVRKYKPKKILLLLTPEIEEKTDMNGKNIVSILKDEIRKRSRGNCRIEKKVISNHNTYDYNLILDNDIKYYDIVNDFIKGFEEYNLLVNVTSGTAQIKTRIALECINSDIDVMPIYIDNPLRLKVNVNQEKNDTKVNNSEVKNKEYKKNDIVKDSEVYKEPKKSKHLDKLDKLDTIFEDYEEYTILREIEINEKEDKYYRKYNFPKIVVFMKDQIKALLDNSFEYKTVYNLFENNYLKNKNEVLDLLLYADSRLNFDYKKAEFNSNDKDYIQCFQYEHLKLDDELRIVEYYNIMRNKFVRRELSDFLLRLRPFFKNIINFLNKNLIFEKEIKKLEYIKSELEPKLRNYVSHQIVKIDNDSIKKALSGTDYDIDSNISYSDDPIQIIVDEFDRILENIFQIKFNGDDFLYNKINKKILEKL